MSDKVLAIDPGTQQSACAEFQFGRLTGFYIKQNADMLAWIRSYSAEWHMPIEMVASYGMPVGEEVFETVVWIGRFIEAFKGKHTKIKRKEVCLTLCNSPRANDSAIRQRIIDLYGGKDKAIGRKKTPGPLYGVHDDEWAAIAVALTYFEMQKASAVA